MSIDWLLKTRRIFFLTILFLIGIIIKYTFYEVGFLIYGYSIENLYPNIDRKQFFMWAVVIIPFFESLFFFWLVIESYSWVFFKKLKFVRTLITTFPALLISTILFANVHDSSNFHVFYALSGGLIYSISYELSCMRKESGLLNIYILHAIWNLTVFLLVEIQ